MADPIHVYPLNDLREHLTDTQGPHCWCRPRREEDGVSIVYIHNSMDRREEYEPDADNPRKPS